MKKLGLLGKNISYSFSKKYFAEKFKALDLPNYSYDVFDIQDKKEIKELFSTEDLVGFNITIPYKQEIIPYLDELSAEAKEIGAVNTVKISEGKRTGHNTDAYGFEESLLPLLNNEIKSALILGSGGASKAIVFVLKKLGIRFQIISRNSKNNYESLTQEKVQNNLLIVNTTPVGTFPDIEKYPNFPTDFLTSQHLVYDLIYNPEKTKLLKLAEEKGATIKNGLEMLCLQAEKAWDIWTEK